MKYLIAILLIVGVLCQSMSSLVVVLNYKINKAYIAKNLCVNRDKPHMKCCGKCYLKKQLIRSEEGTENGKQLPNKIDKTDFTAVLIPANIFNGVAMAEHINSFNPVEQDMFHSSVSEGIFHPPSVVC